MALIDLPTTRRDRPTWRDHDHSVGLLLHRRAELPPAHPDRHRLRHQAIEMGLPGAALLARRYAGRGEALADLTQVASLGLVKAVDGFDPVHGTEFWSYATPTITGELKRYFRDSGWAVQVPRRYKDLQQEVYRRRDELIQRLHRMPRIADLANHLGAERGEIAQALVAENGYSATSLFAPSQGGKRTGMLDRIGTDEGGYDLVDLRESIYPALAKLSGRERQIITMRFFGNMTQSQIAAEVGLSQMHVSRLIPRILRRLREILRDTY